MPGLGASPFGYKIAEQFGLKVLPTRAGWCRLRCINRYLNSSDALWRVCSLRYYAEDGTVFRENLLFTHRGLSGPAVLQISSYWQPGEFVTVNLCLIAIWMLPNEQRTAHPNQSLKNTLAMQLPKRLVECLQVWGRSRMSRLSSSTAATSRLVDTLTNWRVQPNGTKAIARRK
jgi:predicted flavoprotein YhiN